MLLSQTSESAVRLLIFIVRVGEERVTSRRIAAAMGGSESYLAKIMRQLVHELDLAR